MGSTPPTGTLPAQMEEVRARLRLAASHAERSLYDDRQTFGPDGSAWPEMVLLLEAVEKVLPVQHDDQQGGVRVDPEPEPAAGLSLDTFEVDCSYCETTIDAASEPISCEGCVSHDGEMIAALLRAIDPDLAEEFDAGDVNVADMATRACAAVAALRSAPAKAGG